MSRWRETLRVLLVEDDEDDVLITRDLLAAQDRVHFELDWVADFDEALERIAAHTHDVYLVDYRLGRHTGLDLVRAAFPGEPLAPVVLLTGQGDWEVDVAATQLGVSDYLLKSRLDPSQLERSLRYAVRQYETLGELRRSEERYALAARATNDG
ncbi:MAG TPA: response regulator, partial [Solirubrobacteraceae bacterium]|nr:response regulator [Solirubrobacteraceae bacterium]